MDQRLILNRFQDGSVEVLRPTMQLPLRPGQEERFTIYVENRGDPARVGFRALGELSELVLFLRDNVLVERESAIPVRVRMPEGEPRVIHGRIEISTRYAASGEGFDLELGAAPRDDDGEPAGSVVPVDQAYAEGGTLLAGGAALPQRTERHARRTPAWSPGDLAGAQTINWVLVAVLALLAVATFYLGVLPPLCGAVATSVVLVYLLARLTLGLLRGGRGRGSAPPMGGGEIGTLPPKRFDRL